MAKPPVIDAQFEVISGPTPVQWQRPRRRGPDFVTVLRWIPVVVLVVAALFTAFIGLIGGDIDTTEPERPAVTLPADAIPVQPVESFR